MFGGAITFPSTSTIMAVAVQDHSGAQESQPLAMASSRPRVSSRVRQTCKSFSTFSLCKS